MAAALLDIDGTLVDTNYHHALAWHRAFRRHGITLPMWRVHRSIGMGGDQLVTALCGEDTERDLGDAVRDAEKELYGELLGEVAPMAGARELIVDLRDRGHTVVLASSAKPEETEHYVDQLDARELVEGWTTSGDVESTKPEPDLVSVAHEAAGDGPAFMVGDSTWDCIAARRAGVPTIALLTGGFGEAELTDVGAHAVFESLDDLRAALDRLLPELLE